MRDPTRVIRSTLSHTVAGEPLLPGPVFAAPYHTPGDPTDTPYTYARTHNPTWTHLEKAIGEMESGPGYNAGALVFASGMAACTAVFGAILRPGDIVVLPSNAYYTARILAQEYFSKMGIILRLAPTANNAQAEHLEGAKLLWLETPSNPTMEICDIAALSEAAHRAGALVAVDNTTPTPLGQFPIAGLGSHHKSFRRDGNGGCRQKIVAKLHCLPETGLFADPKHLANDLKDRRQFAHQTLRAGSHHG